MLHSWNTFNILIARTLKLFWKVGCTFSTAILQLQLIFTQQLPLSLHFSLSSPRWGENQQTGLMLGTAQRAFSSSVKYLSHDAVLTSSAKWSHYFIEMKVLWNPPSHHHFIEHQHSYKHSFEDIGTSFNKSLEKKITLETRQILRFQSSYPSLFQPSPKET